MILLPLPLSDLYGLHQLDAMVRLFTAHHGEPPNENSTLERWWAIDRDLSRRLWFATGALPHVYPQKSAALWRGVAAASLCSARRAKAGVFVDSRLTAGLALAGRWLGGVNVSATQLLRAAGDPSQADTDAAAACCAAIHATVYAIYAIDGASYAVAALTDAAFACFTAEAAAGTANYTEAAIADLDDLLATVFQTTQDGS